MNKENDDINEKLIFASYSNNFEDVKKLIESGADINYINNKKLTPFISSFRSYEIMEYLLQKGCEYNVKMSNGYNIIMCVIREKYNVLKKLQLIEKYCKNIDINEKNNLGLTALMIASAYCKPNNIDVIEYLFSMGANPDLQDNNGETALMISSKYSNEESCYDAIITLINYGAKIDIVNNQNKNVLEIAKESDKADPKVIQLLENIFKKN